MAIVAAFSMLGAFFMGGLYVAGALGAIALILMKFFSLGNPNLWNIMGNRAWEGTTNFILIAIPLFILTGGTGPPQRDRRVNLQRPFPGGWSSSPVD